MTRLVTADARKVSGADFFAAVTGRPMLTKEQREAAWRADCERYADMIENGSEWVVPPPYLRHAKAIVEERQQLTECLPDPLPHVEPKRRAA